MTAMAIWAASRFPGEQEQQAPLHRDFQRRGRMGSMSASPCQIARQAGMRCALSRRCSGMKRIAWCSTTHPRGNISTTTLTACTCGDHWRGHAVPACLDSRREGSQLTVNRLAGQTEGDNAIALLPGLEKWGRLAQSVTLTFLAGKQRAGEA